MVVPVSTADRARRGAIFVLISAVIGSTGGVAIKLTHLTAPQIAGGRAAFAAVLVYLLVPSARGPWTRGVVLTAIPYAATCTLFVWANTLTTAANAIFIQNIAPVWVCFLAPRFLGERPTRWEVISIPVSLLGCALFFADSLGPGRTAGNTLAAVASFAYAFLIVSYRRYPGDGMTAVVLGNVLIVAICGPFAFAGPVPAPSDIAVIAYLGIVQQAMAVAFFVVGLREVGALEGALLLLLEPMLSPLWAFWLVGERLGAAAVAGAALVLFATLGRTLARSRRS